MPSAMRGDILRRGDGKQFEKTAVQLNDGIAGAERMLAARRDALPGGPGIVPAGNNDRRARCFA